MKVLKFGGTSVGSVENMRAVMQLITDGNQKVVVLSAMSGTTNSLVEIANYLHKKNKDSAPVQRISFTFIATASIPTVSC